MRILVGTYELCGFTTDLAEGLRRLGHDVTCVATMGHVGHPHLQYDVVFTPDELARVNWSEVARRLLRPRPLLPARVSPRSSAIDRLVVLIALHDVFVFIQSSLRPDRPYAHAQMGIGREYALLSRLGKRIVTLFGGVDARHPEVFAAQCAAMRLPAPPSISREGQSIPLAWPFDNVRRAELYSDVIYSQPNQAGLALRPYRHFFGPIALDESPCAVPEREVPVVVHAPSVRSIKGTEHVLAALEQLRAEGVPFTLRLVENVSALEVRRALAEADVAIDQLHLPLHGRLGVEALAAGAALATCDRPDFEPVPASRPIWHIDTEVIIPRLRRLLTDRALRVELARRGRAYAEAHHDHVAVARGLIEALETPDTFHHRPTFFARSFRLPPGARLAASRKSMTARVVRRWGLPCGVSARDLSERGLWPDDALASEAETPSRPSA